ncbi:PREDICTED: NAC domain-containing protein 37-like [Camelina sativa]|uniref:NAC domain-containing protein 37-like n=1 Tax=Camelina sativa TaxID=90675 RepID=A0ABM1QR51_CAMSA|nr:PREDICTED: NAC domain-containing protein 37-like [Camelina sativa]
MVAVSTPAPESSTVATAPITSLLLPRGFVFEPSDEQLLFYYLRRKLLNKSYPNAIADVEFYNHDPWDLIAKSRLKSNCVWYFFSRKSTAGETKRSTPSGIWVSGGDKKVLTDKSSTSTGLKTSFNFFPESESNDVEHDAIVLCKVSVSLAIKVEEIISEELFIGPCEGECVLNREASVPPLSSSSSVSDDEARYRLIV